MGFRWFAREIAEDLGVRGYVRNFSDDGVEVVAEGEEGLLAKLLGTLRQGPTHAHVDSVDAEWSNPTGEFHGFIIRK